MELIKCYTDASYSNTKNVAVIGSKIGSEPIDILILNNTNNTRAEIIGVINLMEKLKIKFNTKYVIYTDCQGVLNIIAKKSKLINANFTNKKNETLRNTDLYKKLYELLRPDIEICHIKGHIPKQNMTPDNVIFSELDKYIRKKLRKLVCDDDNL